jgi:hypothetical protein
VITDDCGPHRHRGNAENTVTREGHCPCCHPGAVPGPIGASLTRRGRPAGCAVPMCWAWYDRSADAQAWEHETF